MAEISVKDLPKNLRELYEKGYLAMERGRFDFAQDMFLLVLKKEPRLLKARRWLRLIQIKQAKENPKPTSLFRK